MPDRPTEWLLLAASLPGRDASTARVRLWRSLKEIGAANLRDGVTLIPASETHRERLAKLTDEIAAGDGAAWLFSLPSQDSALEKKLRAQFDRSETYASLTPEISELRKDLPSIDEAAARRRFRQLERELESIVALDFFPGTSQQRAKERLSKLREAIDRRFSPEEPASATGAVPRRSARRYQGALWATRKRIWVDRVASAWLIKRFIDARARFLWLASPVECPRDAHGFDFDGAAFTHVDDRVTFQVLAASFGLDGDAGIARLGDLVRYLDIGGKVVAEAAGFEAVLAGLRDAARGDDELLDAALPVLDALYQHFSGGA